MKKTSLAVLTFGIGVAITSFIGILLNQHRKIDESITYLFGCVEPPEEKSTGDKKGYQ